MEPSIVTHINQRASLATPNPSHNLNRYPVTHRVTQQVGTRRRRQQETLLTHFHKTQATHQIATIRHTVQAAQLLIIPQRHRVMMILQINCLANSAMSHKKWKSL